MGGPRRGAVGYGKNRAGLWESRRRIDLIEANIVPLAHGFGAVAASAQRTKSSGFPSEFKW